MSSALFANLTAEDLIAEEEGHQASEPSIPSTLGKRASQSRDSDDESNDEDEEEPASPRNENPPSRSNGTTHPNPASLQIEQVIRRTAKRLKLPNDEISLVESFAQEHSLDARLVLLYSSTLSVRSELAELQRSTGATSYQIGKELEDNVKKYSRLVLLNASIYHYKGNMPKDCLTKIILKYRFGIPQNIEANGHAWAKITGCIDRGLTQARSTLKKVLQKDARRGNAQLRFTIYKLARAMVNDESYTISPAMCTRVAIMRQVYTSFTGDKFWDEVDKILDSMKPMSEEKRISYLKAILSRDRRTYGVAPGEMAAAPSVNPTAAGEESLVQQRIEDCIDIVPGGVAVA